MSSRGTGKSSARLSPLQKERKAVADLTIAMTIGVLLAFMNLTLNFSGSLHDFFSDYITAEVMSWIVNVLFFWLVLLLWLAFRRWRQESHQRAELENVISSISPDALIVVSPDRTIDYCNASVTRIFGYAPEDVLGQTTDLLYYDRRQDKSHRGEIRDALEFDGFHVGSATGKRADGSTVPLEIITGNLSGSHGAVLLLRDITERVESEQERAHLEAKVRQRQKLESLGILAGGIAHDFNNLLMGILGNAELVLSGAESDSRAYRQMEGIKTAAVRAGELCKQLLSYSGRGGFLKQPINMSQIVSEMCDLLSISISKNVTIDYHLKEDISSIHADPSQMRQIVMNFITNASDAAEHETCIVSVRTGVRHCEESDLKGVLLDEDRPPGDYVFLEVADSGCGMDSETLARIFDPFFTTKVTGRGLGLAAVLGIVRGHNGCIKVESALGQGSVFTVLFPKTEAEVQPLPSMDTDAQVPLGGHVLLVDDEEIVRSVGRELLEHLGFSVTVAIDGAEAVELYKDIGSELDLVLLDMTMPNMTGQEAMRHILKRHPEQKVVLSSGYNKDAAVVGDGDVRPAAFIQKPYELNSLREILSRVMNK
ncbi:MAG: response regulator [Kiritimatiellae bacterium]|nr:response regulator [Kiritimatiellia bacterium]